LETLLAAIGRGETSGEAAALISGDVETMRAVLSRQHNSDRALFSRLMLCLLDALPLADALQVIDAKLLGSANSATQRLLGEFLRHAPAEVADARLAKLLASPHAAARRAAAIALALRGDDLSPLLDIASGDLSDLGDLGDGALSDMGDALRAVAEIAHPRADALSVRALKGAALLAQGAVLDGLARRTLPLSPALSEALLASWGALASAEDTGDLVIWRGQVLEALGLAQGDEAHRVLLDALRAPDGLLREAAAMGLARRGDIAALERAAGLHGEPQDGGADGSTEALAALASLPAWRASALGAFRSHPPALRVALLAALDPEAHLPLLLAALRDGTPAEQVAAAERLGEARCAEAVPLLLERLSHQQPRDLKLAALEALALIGDGRALDPLWALTEDPDPMMRPLAAFTLQDLGWMPSPEANPEGRARLLAHLQQWERCVALGAPARPALIAALQRAEDDALLAAQGDLEGCLRLGPPAHAILATWRDLTPPPQAARAALALRDAPRAL
jgi:HEAT repeat protein